MTVPMPINGRVRSIDAGVAHIVAALNAAGLVTTGSCSGHGKMPGSVMLDDGRELMIAPDHETARRWEKLLIAAGEIRPLGEE